MKCETFKELIPLYFSGDLAASQQAEFEEHLAACAECRAEVQAYRLMFEKSHLGEHVPANPDLVSPVMQEVRSISTGSTSDTGNRTRWLRPAAAIAVVAVILAVVVTAPWKSGLTPAQLVVHASEPEVEIQSCRMEYISEKISDGGSLVTQMQVLFMSPERYRHITTIGDWGREYVTVDGAKYSKETGTPVYTSRSIILSFDERSHKDATLDMLDQLESYTELPDEEIDGVPYYKLEGTFPDLDPINSLPQGDLTDKEYQTLLDHFHKEKTTSKAYFWIDKDTYAIKQMRFEEFDWQNNMVWNSTVTYYDFNQEFSIEPPLDDTGQLLPGWEQIE